MALASLRSTCHARDGTSLARSGLVYLGSRTSAWKGRRCRTGESKSRVAAGRRGKALLCATKRRQRRRPQAAQWQLRARGSAAPYVRGGGGTDEGPRWRQSGRTWSGRGTLRLYAAQLCLVVRIKRGAACVRKRQDRHSQRECKKVEQQVPPKTRHAVAMGATQHVAYVGC